MHRYMGTLLCCIGHIKTLTCLNRYQLTLYQILVEVHLFHAGTDYLDLTVLNTQFQNIQLITLQDFIMALDILNSL